MTIKVFEGFAGVGSQRMALRDLGLQHEVVATSDWDYHATLSYSAIHTDNPIDYANGIDDRSIIEYLFKLKISSNGKEPMTMKQIARLSKKREVYNAFKNTNNLGSITEIKPSDIPDHDLFTYSFPCQDISAAGHQRGLDEDSQTRSSLLWQCRKVIESKKPKYLLLENVKNLVGKRHRHNFDKWLDWLTEQGYTNYWQVLNAKDYGVPQNRERVFVVSILGEHESFEFPEPIELTRRLKDVLESQVDEKYYLKGDKALQLLAQFANKNIKDLQPIDGSLKNPKERDISNCISARNDRGISNRQGEGMAIVKKIGNVNPSRNGMNGDVFSDAGISPTLTTNKGEGPKIIQKARGFNKGGEHNLCPSITISSWRENNFVALPAIAASRGRNPDNPSDRTAGNYVEQRLEVNKKGVSNTITTVQKDNYVIEESGIYINDSPNFHRGALKGISRSIKAGNHDAGVINGYRIRKLIPLECWRLLDFSDEDFYNAQAVCSNSQLYKQAGNSIVKAVLMAIFREMFAVRLDGDSGCLN